MLLQPDHSAFSNQHPKSNVINFESIRMFRSTLFLYIALVVLLNGMDCALVCGSSSCSGVSCDNMTTGSCKGGSVYKAKHSGRCACCPACVSYLELGAKCQTYSKELGETPSAVCKEPQLMCISGTCQTPPLKYSL